jgi:hypothetical protein
MLHQRSSQPEGLRPAGQPASTPQSMPKLHDEVWRCSAVFARHARSSLVGSPQTRRGGARARARFERGRQHDPVFLVAERGDQARALVRQLLHRQRGRRLQHLRGPRVGVGAGRRPGWGCRRARAWLVVDRDSVRKTAGMGCGSLLCPPRSHDRIQPIALPNKAGILRAHGMRAYGARPRARGKAVSSLA